MEYKYQKRQLFGKRLKVPKNILTKVYNSALTFNEFIDYELDDKIPTSCLTPSDRQIVERFGLERAKTLDWELLNKHHYYITTNFKELIMTISPSETDINAAFYELVKDQIRPSDYSMGMKKTYPNRVFVLPTPKEDSIYFEMQRFNNGNASLVDIIRNWSLYQSKDLSYCLQNDANNGFNITNEQLKEFMLIFASLSTLFLEYTDIYSFIYGFHSLEDELERKSYIRQVTDIILDKTVSQNPYQETLQLSEDQYRLIFNYSSLGDYLKRFDSYYGEIIADELSTLPSDYLFNMPFPFNILKNDEVIKFIAIYGLKNVVDFDNECGHFFSQNNCEMLQLMYKMYLQYSANVHDPNKKLDTKNNYDSEGHYIDRPYTKDEFYEAVRRMIIYGPTDYNYINKAPDYRAMTGEFRNRNAELFISNEAPDALQKLFYTKSITPKDLVQHPEFIPYLIDKDLSSCFKSRPIRVEGSSTTSGYENFYKFLSTKTDFNGLISFITEYSDVLDLVLDFYGNDSYQYEIMFSKDDNIADIKSKINASFRKMIIEKNLAYPKNIPADLVANYPSMFLPPNAPKELQTAFYSRHINTDFILSNPLYQQYLKDIDVETLYKYMPVNIASENQHSTKINLISAIKQTFGTDSFAMLLAYGHYLEKVFATNQFQNFTFQPTFSPDELLTALDTSILDAIINNGMKYAENIPAHFIQNNPTLFLKSNVLEDIRQRFYNREFTLNDFNDNPDLLNFFNETNIVCAFSNDISWMIPLFSNISDLKTANYNRLQVIAAYSQIQDTRMQTSFKEYILECGDDIDITKIEYASVVLSRLSLSNSTEMYTFRKQLATQILNSSNPLESLAKIEDVFIRNNMPTIGKIYSCFEILHPDFKGFNFDNSMISPILKKSSTMSKKIIVFADLIKAAFGSNNRSVNAYLKNITTASNLYESIISGSIKYPDLDENQKKELDIFAKHLITLYHHTMRGQKEMITFSDNEDALTIITKLSQGFSPNDTPDYNLADRVIRMFCGFASIDTLEQAINYVNQTIKTADAKNRNTALVDMQLKPGDFVKGIGDITYLRNILQNGSISKEYLGASAGSDATPLDTDVSMISHKEGNIREQIARTAASRYGPIWFVLKNDERFIITRNNQADLNVKNDMSKIEVFYTGALGEDHYGIRTGFASSVIDYIVMETYDARVGLEIAMNGFYIPVANLEGKIVFTPHDYDQIRAKMQGLSHYDEYDYVFSDNLVSEETTYFAEQIAQSNYEVQEKRAKINEVIKRSLQELGLHLKPTIDGDLTEGYVELIDTGSTGRGTNKPGDGDFDFMMRLDKNILSSPTKMTELKQTLLRNLGKENSSEFTPQGDFRLKDVEITPDIIVDIDITFTEKTNHVTYSTDMSLQDRLSTIQKTNPEKYKYVIANILLAKQVLKQGGVYKPNRGEQPQGGLGGVGIENWVLQHGGSFSDAARSFLVASQGKSFAEFKACYEIWDFGENHLAERRGQYAYDNFVANNMSEAGYEKMLQVLNEYMLNHSHHSSETIQR